MHYTNKRLGDENMWNNDPRMDLKGREQQPAGVAILMTKIEGLFRGI